MATHFKGPAKPRATQKLAPISLKDELEADEPIQAPADVSFAASAAVEDEPLALMTAETAAPPSLAPVEIAPVEILAPVAVEPAASAEPAVIIAAMTATLAPPALLAPEPAVAASAPDLDPSALPLKTLDLFNENAAAVLDFALALGAAKSVGDAFELQSRFASERYSSLVRQAGEFAELTRRLAFQNNPVKLSFSAFIA
jgi:cell division septation protein DedD